MDKGRQKSRGRKSKGRQIENSLSLSLPFGPGGPGSPMPGILGSPFAPDKPGKPGCPG